jgi:hypothetical protein
MLGHASEATTVRFYGKQSLTEEELSEGVETEGAGPRAQMATALERRDRVDFSGITSRTVIRSYGNRRAWTRYSACAER